MYKGATKLSKYIRDGIRYFGVVYHPISLESKANILKQHSDIKMIHVLIISPNTSYEFPVWFDIWITNVGT